LRQAALAWRFRLLDRHNHSGFQQPCSQPPGSLIPSLTNPAQELEAYTIGDWSNAVVDEVAAVDTSLAAVMLRRLQSVVNARGAGSCLAPALSTSVGLRRM